MINPAYLAKLIEAHWAKTATDAPASVSKLEASPDTTVDSRHAA